MRVGLALVVAACGVAVAQSASTWPPFQGGPEHLGVAAAAPAPPYRQSWRWDPGITGRFGVSAPVIAGEIVVTVAPHEVVGLDLGTGAEA